MERKAPNKIASEIKELLKRNIDIESVETQWFDLNGKPKVFITICGKELNSFEGLNIALYLQKNISDKKYQITSFKRNVGENKYYIEIIRLEDK